jgi:hypothetical protein
VLWLCDCFTGNPLVEALPAFQTLCRLLREQCEVVGPEANAEEPVQDDDDDDDSAPTCAEVDPAVRARVGAGEVDLVTFTASSTVRRFCDLLTPEELAVVWARASAVCIGPATAASARRGSTWWV